MCNYTTSGVTPVIMRYFAAIIIAALSFHSFAVVFMCCEDGENVGGLIEVFGSRYYEGLIEVKGLGGCRREGEILRRGCFERINKFGFFEGKILAWEAILF